MKSLRAIFLLTCLSALVACGQKGDLYFPDQKAVFNAGEGLVVGLENYGLF